jgi:1-phosphofructokinase
MILTVTLNPAIDRTIEVPSFTMDRVNRCEIVQRDIGGKGLNVTKTIHALGGNSKALLVLGGENGEFIANQSKKSALDVAIFKIDGNTRENIKIVDPVKQTYTDINEKGPSINGKQLKALERQIKDLLSPEDWLVISGSAVEGVTEAFYESIFAYARDRDIRIIADVNGNQLKRLLPYNPYLIKPNIHELEELFNVSIKDVDEAISYAKCVIDKGVKVVVVSLGDEGLLWVDRGVVLYAPALKVDVKSTVGAGDAIVGGLTYGLSEGEDKFAIIKRAVAAATCVITTNGSQTGDMALYQSYYHQITVQKK